MMCPLSGGQTPNRTPVEVEDEFWEQDQSGE